MIVTASFPICFSCSDKTPQTGRYKQQAVIPRSDGHWDSKTMAPADSVSAEKRLSGSEPVASCCVLSDGRS